LKTHEIQQPTDTAIRFIPLTQGQIAIVDVWNYERLSRFAWHAHRKRGIYYAIRSESKDGRVTRIAMHQEVMNPPEGFTADHVNPSATLDNREANLRVATTSQQCANRRVFSNNKTGFKGVFWRGGRSKRYRVVIYKKGVGRPPNGQIDVGSFLDPIEAAKAYDEAAIRLFGEFAQLNFPQDVENKQVI
jgi:hypothetical protein